MSARAPEILVVEDDPAIRESLVECLELEGHTVRAAADGPEALAWLREGNRPRVVLLDLVMPAMSGEELVNEIRSAPATRDLPLVIMTGASPGQGRLPRVDALVKKPFEMDDLLRAMGPFLGPA
jgi:two-component system chemotaxis response regulator CheY